MRNYNINKFIIVKKVEFFNLRYMQVLWSGPQKNLSSVKEINE